MGTFIKGILGGFSGKIGTVIGATWRTLDVMKSRPKKSNKPPVQEQIDQRFIFGLVTTFLSKLEKVIAVGYRANVGVLTPMNAAVRENINHAIIGVSPVFSIDFTKLVLSRGPLDIGRGALIVPIANHHLTVSWETAIGHPLDVELSNTDKVMLLLYNPANRLFLRVDTAIRGDGTLDVRMISAYRGLNHAWLFFSEAKGKKVSDTQYLGVVTTID